MPGKFGCAYPTVVDVDGQLAADIWDLVRTRIDRSEQCLHRPRPITDQWGRVRRGPDRSWLDDLAGWERASRPGPVNSAVDTSVARAPDD